MDIAPPPIEIATALAGCSHELVSRLDRDLGGLGLTWAQLRALLALRDQRGLLHAGGLGRRLGVSRQAAHALLLRLDAHGFVTWKDDDWIKSARLTSSGELAAREAIGAASLTLEALARLGVEDRKALVRITREVGRELRRPAYERPWWWD